MSGCHSLVMTGQRDGIESLPIWFDVFASWIVEFCLSALLFYFLAFVHLVMRVMPLRRDAPRRNYFTLRCRSFFHGAPVRCAVFFALCMLPQVHATRADLASAPVRPLPTPSAEAVCTASGRAADSRGSSSSTTWGAKNFGEMPLGSGVSGADGSCGSEGLLAQGVGFQFMTKICRF